MVSAYAREAYVPEQVMLFSPEDEAVYQQRLSALREARRVGRGLTEYSPLERVEGADPENDLPIVPSERRSLPMDALKEAGAYAEKMNSTSLLIWRNGKLEYERYFGTTTRDELLVARSLAKPLTAIVVGRAIELGYIRGLDQPVSDFIPEWRGDERREQMLIRHMLDMRSGFLPQSRSDHADSPLNRAYLHPRHDQVIIHEYPLVDQPGSRFEYSNATSQLVAVVIERATGMRYASFISEKILLPLGAAGGKVWVNREGGTAHAGCCILLPARTWLRLGILLLQDGQWGEHRLLPTGYVAEMRTGTEQNIYYGLGVYVAGPYTERRGFTHPDRPSALSPPVLHSEPYLAEDLFMFDGNGNQVVYIVPSAQLVIMRTGNRPGPGHEWDNSILPNLVLRALPVLEAAPQAVH